MKLDYESEMSSDLTFGTYNRMMDTYQDSFNLKKIDTSLSVGFDDIGIGILIMQSQGKLECLKIDPYLTTGAWYISAYIKELDRYLTFGSHGV